MNKLIFAFTFIILLSGLVLASENRTCVDSDGGINYSIAGTATFTHPSTGSLFNESDFCINNIILSEQYCKSDYEINHVIYPCPIGCKEGACVDGIPPAPAIPRCLTGEYGQRINYYQRGNASYIDSNTGNLISEEDFCMNNKTLSKQSCKPVFNGNTLLRVTLENNAIRCPYGCLNGACILDEQGINQAEPINLSELENCAGCKESSQCYPLGYRKSNMFCADINEFISQKQARQVCDNNFECSTNLCIDSQCVSSGTWQRFLHWFKRLFGAE